MFGYPAAGKGTQAAKLSRNYNIPHISTGEIFRENMENKTPLGIEIDELMRAGNLVPDETTNRIVFDKLDRIGEGWILDGYPRSLPQAEAFKAYIKDKGWDVIYLYISIDRYEAMYRSKKRSEELNRFEDASDEVINKRMDVFEDTTAKAVNYFKDEIQKINGFYSEQGVYDKIIEYLKWR
jgi:adenylate kinase